MVNQMIQVFVTIAIISLTNLSSINCFKFPITRILSSTDALEKSDWCFAEIIENENVAVTVEIPWATTYSGIYIYFANEHKEILQVNLNEVVHGKFYEIPYKLIKEMEGEKTATTEKSNFRQVTGEFPSFWLPNNFNKVSATVECADGRILNYYGIQNLKISLPDLMILEEFKIINKTEKNEK